MCDVMAKAEKKGKEAGKKEAYDLFARLMTYLRENKLEDIITKVLKEPSLVSYYCNMYKIK